MDGSRLPNRFPTESGSTQGVVLFMAVDIVGSSEFKMQFRDEANEAFWLKPFENFFQWTPLRFVGRVAEVYSHEDSIPETNVWRVRGDEIIFLSRLSRASDASSLSLAFMRTVEDCNQLVLSDSGLRVRGCCWAAQLSGRNRVIMIPEMYHGFHDYLGPDVDAGFRLSTCAPDGQVAYSYNLVHLIGSQTSGQNHRFRYTEDRVLRGVADQLPYPIVTSSSSAASEPETFPDDASDVVRKVNSGHPAAEILKQTLVRL
jgi:hypothetical protein